MPKFLKKAAKWAKARAFERSTYVGVATILGAVGLGHVGATVEQIGTAVALIGGGGLMALATKPEA